METKEKKVEFYGGAVGVWTPVIVMLIGMIINTVLAGGLTTLPMVTFLAMAVGFLLAKDKKTFGSVTLKGLQNPMFGTEAVAFIFAGILAQLLRQSGLIQALIYVVAQLELNTGLIPLIAFLTCMLISTACGTSTGAKLNKGAENHIEMKSVDGSDIQIPADTRLAMAATLQQSVEVGDHILHICQVDKFLGDEDKKGLYAWNGFGKVASAAEG